MPHSSRGRERQEINLQVLLLVAGWGIKIIAFAFQSHRLKKGGNLHAHQSAELHQSRNGVSFLTPRIFVATLGCCCGSRRALVRIRAAVGCKNAAIESTASAWTKVTRHETGSSHGAQSPQVGASGLVSLRGGEAVQSDGFFGVWRNTSTCLKHFAQ